MKYVLLLACAFVLSFFSGCASTGNATQQAAGGAVAASTTGAADWLLSSTFKAFGLTLTDKPAPALNGPGHIVVSSAQDLKLLAMFSDAAGTSGSSQTVEPQHTGSQWAFDLYFAKSGTYTVTLLGRPASDTGNSYTVLATTKLTVSLDLPANWEFAAAWWKDGVSLVSSPPLAVGDEAVINLAATQALSYAYSISNTTTGRTVEDAVSFGGKDPQTTITLFFPESGDYELGLWVKPTSDKGDDYERLSTARFHATVDPATIPVLPANWKAGPGARKFGVSLVSSPTGAVADAALVQFTTKSEITLLSALERKTGDTTERVSGMVDTDVNATQCTARVYFPRTGSYTLTLWGAAKDQADSIVLARVSFEVKLPDRSGLLASNWNVNPRFWAYGLNVTAAPPRAVGDSLAIVITAPAGVTISASLHGKATGDYISTVSTDTVGSEQRVSAVFPKSGEYELSLTGKNKDDKYSTTVATATFLSTFDDTAARYRLWRMNGSWPLVPVTKVETVTAAWKPRGQWSETEEHKKGVLSADLTLPVGDTTVTLRKGAVVEFDLSSGGSSVGTFAFTLPKDVSMKVDASTVLLKAGSAFAMDGYGFAGAASKDMKIAVPGGEVACPRGSRLVVDDGSLTEIQLQGKGTYTAAKKVYECSGSVIVETSCFSDYPSTVHITNAKAAPLQFGTTKLTVPEGSAMVFTEKGIDHVAPVRDMVVTVNGQAQTVAQGWAARFDETGAMETFQAE